MNDKILENSKLLLDLFIYGEFDFYPYDENELKDYLNYIPENAKELIESEDKFDDFVNDWINNNNFEIVEQFNINFDLEDQWKTNEVIIKYQNKYYRYKYISYYHLIEPEFISSPVEVEPYETTVIKYRNVEQ